MKRFVRTWRSFWIRAESCMDSREMLSGKSALSTTPLTKRSHSGRRPLGSASMRTFLQ